MEIKEVRELQKKFVRKAEAALGQHSKLSIQQHEIVYEGSH